MDEECKKELGFNRCCFKIMNRVIEEDIFSRFLKKGARGHEGLPHVGACFQTHPANNHLRRGQSWGTAAPGLTPDMLQENPARRLGLLQSSRGGSLSASNPSSPSSFGGAGASSSSLSERYFDELERCTLESEQVQRRLSQGQYQSLLDLKNSRDELVRYAASSRKRLGEEGGGITPMSAAPPPEKINVRAISRVPSR
jgi:hypothetical protein